MILIMTILFFLLQTFFLLSTELLLVFFLLECFIVFPLIGLLLGFLCSLFSLITKPSLPSFHVIIFSFCF